MRAAESPAGVRGLGGVSPRITSLDGLRGLAALVVVFGHVAILAPSLAQQFSGAAPRPGQPWWLAQTPLHLAWAGGEAVYVFFIMSGYVLVAPLMGDASRRSNFRTWMAYYPRRLSRICLPMWAAAVVTVLVVLCFPRLERPDWSWWYAKHGVEVTGENLLRMAMLLPEGTWLNSPLWSLRWELFFSLLLPVFVFGAVASRRSPIVTAVSVILLLAVSKADVLPSFIASAFFYLGMFAVGALLAACGQTLVVWLNRRRALWWACLGCSAVGLMQPAWLWPGHPPLEVLSALGAALVVVAFIGCTSMKRLGNARPCQFLGQISFSLYLIHEPLVLSVASVVNLGSQAANILVVATVAVPLSLFAAFLFHRWVEAPAHRLSRVVGRVSESAVRGARRAAPSVTDVSPGRSEAETSRVIDVRSAGAVESGAARPDRSTR